MNIRITLFNILINHLGSETTLKQEYNNINDDYLQADLLKAFKQNPYTKPIGSIA
jgi:hypothetical protein